MAVAAQARTGSAVLAARQAFFARMWAIAALAHVIGNGFAGQLVPRPDVGGLALLLVATASIVTLLRPTRLALVVLAAVVVASAVIEIPFLGNHWTLAGLISLAYLLSGARWDGFEPAARLVLLVFYSLAAFAKVNSGFFDPDVSCSVVYANQALAAAGLAPLTSSAPATAVLPWVVAGIELAVPVLLVLRWTRWFGVLLALGFHTAVSLDLSQHFYDFTSVLAALFVLFLPAAWTDAARSRLERIPRTAWVITLSVASVLTGLLVLTALLPYGVTPAAVGRLAFVLWVPYAVGLLTLVLLGPRRAGPLPWRPAAASWIAIALVTVNGLTPWTEVKTAFGYTMYANLETAQGSTNHYVVPATLPLRSDLDRLVAVESSDDPGLAAYVDSGWLLPWPSFALYVADRPGVSVTYRDGVSTDGSGGRLVTLAADEGPVDGTGALPWWWRWMPQRAIDSGSPPRCQTVWLPAL